MLLGVSDGGLKFDVGSYGWVIGDNTNVHVEGFGLVPGYPLETLRTESYGLLSLLLFLYHYTTYLDITPTCSFHIHSDNLTMVNACQTSDPQTNLGKALRSDWDVIQQLRLPLPACSLTTSQLHTINWTAFRLHRKRLPPQLSVLAPTGSTLATVLISAANTSLPLATSVTNKTKPPTTSSNTPRGSHASPHLSKTSIDTSAPSELP